MESLILSQLLTRIENLNTSDESNSDKDDTDDGDEVDEPPVDENRNFVNVFNSFVDEDGNIKLKRRRFSILKFCFGYYFSF